MGELNNQKIFARINKDGTKEVVVKKIKPLRFNANKLKEVLYYYCGKKKVDECVEKWISTLESMWRENQKENSIMTLDYISQKYEIVVDKAGEPKLVKVSDDYQRKFIEFLKKECNKEFTLTNNEFEQLCEWLDDEIFKSKIKPKNEPDFIPNGFNHFDGSIFGGDYRIADKCGNIFLWVPECTINEKIVKGHYWSAYPVSSRYCIAKPNEKCYIIGATYEEIENTILKKVSRNMGEGIIVSMGTRDEYQAFCEQIISVMGEHGNSRTDYCGGLNYYTSLKDRKLKIDDEGFKILWNYTGGGSRFEDLRNIHLEYIALDITYEIDVYNVVRVVIRQE